MPGECQCHARLTVDKQARTRSKTITNGYPKAHVCSFAHLLFVLRTTTAVAAAAALPQGMQDMFLVLELMRSKEKRVCEEVRVQQPTDCQNTRLSVVEGKQLPHDFLPSQPHCCVVPPHASYSQHPVLPHAARHFLVKSCIPRAFLFPGQSFFLCLLCHGLLSPGLQVRNMWTHGGIQQAGTAGAHLLLSVALTA